MVLVVREKLKRKKEVIADAKIVEIQFSLAVPEL